MDLSTILLALPIFLITYSGVEYFLSSRKAAGLLVRQRRAFEPRKSVQELSSSVGHLGLNQAILGTRKFRAHLEELLLRAGYPFGWKPEDVLFWKEAALLIAIGACWYADATDPIVWAIACLASFWLPELYLSARGTSRRTEMQKELPGLVDLLALAIESGLDLLVAVERIHDKMKRSALKEELQVMMQESRLGTARKDLLKRWAYRTGLSDSQSLSSLIIQSEEMGTPLSGVLRSYAEDMRNRRVLRAEELAGKIPVKILFPMMVFFFPIVFVIILGPVALEFMKSG